MDIFLVIQAIDRFCMTGLADLSIWLIVYGLSQYIFVKITKYMPKSKQGNTPSLSRYNWTLLPQSYSYPNLVANVSTYEDLEYAFVYQAIFSKRFKCHKILQHLAVIYQA